MKLLILTTGVIETGYLALKSLEQYFDVVKLLGPEEILNRNIYDFGFKIDYDKYWVRQREEFDIILSIDHGGLRVLYQLKEKYPNAKFGTQILDYPIDLINSNYFNIEEKWNEYKRRIPLADFIISNRKSVINDLHDLFINKKYLLISYPFRTIVPTNEYISSNYIVNSGRISIDKRIDKIVDAIELSKSKPSLVIVSSLNKESERIIELLRKKNINIEIYNMLSEQKKFDLYNQCSFVISAHYDRCSPGCIAEGMSLGKNAISFEDGEDSRFNYGDSIEYGNGTVERFAELIDLLMGDLDYREKLKNERIKYYNEHVSYEYWAKKVSEFLYEL